MTNHDFSFEGLRVYKATRQLVKDVYVLVNKLPTIENFALSSQIRRAVVSVKANIAEGSGKIGIIGLDYGLDPVKSLQAGIILLIPVKGKAVKLH